MEKRIVTVIATSGRRETLKRTLQSLNECVFPDSYLGAYVVENGVLSGAREMIESGSWNFKIFYRHISEQNKSKALNLAVNELNEELVYFNDDDVRFDKYAIVSMFQAAAQAGEGAFFGGPLLVDYPDGPPPDWLKRFLPHSACGCKLELANVQECPSWFCFGANWAAYAKDIKRAGGFNKIMGPAADVLGEETFIQNRLSKIGLKKYYVPSALVWHLVPAEHCSVEFALMKASKSAAYKIVNDSNTILVKAKFVLKSFLRISMAMAKMSYCFVRKDFFQAKVARTWLRFELARQRGAFKGLIVWFAQKPLTKK